MVHQQHTGGNIPKPLSCSPEGAVLLSIASGGVHLVPEFDPPLLNSLGSQSGKGLTALDRALDACLKLR